MKRSLIIAFILLFVITIIAYVTKPSDSNCRSVAESHMKNKLEGKMNGFRYALVERLAERTVENGISINDKVLYKQITFTFSGNTKDIGWGAFGNVHIDE
jgi:hypothetical protein